MVKSILNHGDFSLDISSITEYVIIQLCIQGCWTNGDKEYKYKELQNNNFFCLGKRHAKYGESFEIKKDKSRERVLY